MFQLVPNLASDHGQALYTSVVPQRTVLSGFSYIGAEMIGSRRLTRLTIEPHVLAKTRTAAAML